MRSLGGRIYRVAPGVFLLLGTRRGKVVRIYFGKRREAEKAAPLLRALLLPGGVS